MRCYEYSPGLTFSLSLIFVTETGPATCLAPNLRLGRKKVFKCSNALAYYPQRDRKDAFKKVL